MTKDDILQALHQVAMGRARTPLQDQLAELLASVFGKRAPALVADADGMIEVAPGLEVSAEAVLAATPGSIVPVTPKRAKKAS